MYVKRCDRCGGIYEEGDGSFLIVEDKDSTRYYWEKPVKEVDICPACKAAFEEWMKPKEG